MNIVLIGFKNCGKSFTGKMLAEKLQWSFADTDVLLQQMYNHVHNSEFTIPEIYKHEKEQGFRAWEKNAIESLTELRHTIIATGGGCIVDNENIEALKKIGKLIYLEASEETLRERQKEKHTDLVVDKEDRRKRYESAADKIVNIDNRDVIDVMLDIMEYILETSLKYL